MSERADRLLARLADATFADEQRLRERIRRAQRRSSNADEWAKIGADVDRAVAVRAARAASKPRFVYPRELPVSARAADIAKAIRAHPVVIVSGETGSGKTTQLPKICLDAGRGERGLIGHTQPRRIAARAVASRIAQELGTTLGDAVGYKVRFTDRTRPDAYIKLMTDGILLAETQGDRQLSRYDTIIVDEAHERSLNIDFLLGYLKRLLAHRQDLRVVITSATIDAQRFAAHFEGRHGPAPVISVSGRTYPVEVRYRALATGDAETDDEEELEEAIAATAEELWRESPGDILAFLPGEREIRETADVLRRALARRPYASAVEILPLYARLSVDEQQRVFAPSRGRRIVLATNVAETSLTVPGIRFVIDSGLARVRRYSLRNKTTLLQIEKVAQASANQRAGRCGRVQHGICVRLYGEDDFASRPPHPDPEILRSSLAAVILQMASLALGDVAAFPFLDPPSARAITDGYQLLQELEAVDAERALTPRGSELAKLPLDPRIGRIVLAGRDERCLAEVLIIASALSVPDPRERPLERAQAADQAHLQFRDDRSDFLSLIALWEFFDAPAQKALSHRKRVDTCRAHFVSYLRMIEWRDIHAQLIAVLSEAGWTVDTKLSPKIDAVRYATIHRALLAGLLGNIGVRSEPAATLGGQYDGARGIRFFLHPGSGLARKAPKWVLAAELTQTTRLYARCAARIEPEWIEAVAADRVTRDYFDAHWERTRGDVVASERVQLYGLTLVARRPVVYGPIAPAQARDVFIREALVPNDLGVDAPFAVHNKALVEEVAGLEQKSRREDVLVDDETVAAFFAERVPADVYSRATFERWRRSAERRDPALLFLTREQLMRHGAPGVTEALFPETLHVAGGDFPLKYRFAPSHPLDGLTLTVPLARLNQVDEATLSWLVPGMVRDKVTHILRSLPKAFRNRLVPLAETVTDFLSEPHDAARSVYVTLHDYLGKRLGDAPSVDALDAVPLPPHLRMNVRVVDAAGDELGMDRDLIALQQRLREAAQLSFAAESPAFERRGLRRWDFGELPESLAVRRDGERVTGYPALVDEQESVALKLFDTREAAERATREGVKRLIAFELGDALTRAVTRLASWNALALQLRGAIAPERLRQDVVDAVADRAFIGEDPLPRDPEAFLQQVKRARTRLPAVLDSATRMLAAIATEHQALSQQLAALPAAQRMLGAEIRQQRDALVHPGFFAETPWEMLQHLPRYLRALGRRIARHAQNPERDAHHAAQVSEWWSRYTERAAAGRRSGAISHRLRAFRWLIEELRVSLFAQELRTPMPVSLKRVEKAWAEVLRER
ncbi:MAG TPA: ATP-dependent RNA helicase HrpA [Casimicrobiaceae bacterium]|nr:ATP-dependent RNA helicase HrpA [Casimicrobiaceae bacterium]